MFGIREMPHLVCKKLSCHVQYFLYSWENWNRYSRLHFHCLGFPVLRMEEVSLGWVGPLASSRLPPIQWSLADLAFAP